MALDILTYRDLIEHCIRFCGGNATGSNAEDIRSAIQAAYRELAHSNNWSYLYRWHRIIGEASYSTGTITYDHTGGASERLVTLDSGTWPTNLIYYNLIVDGVIYEFASRLTGTTATLDATINPGADIAAGTSYEVVRSNYTLPAGFHKIDHIRMEDGLWGANYVHPSDWLSMTRFGATTGSPQVFTIMRDPKLYGQLAIFLYPAPTEATTIDMLCQLRPRSLRKTGYATAESAGTIACSSASTTITGTGTSFDASMVGSTIRLSSNSTIPTSEGGLNPYDDMRTITGYTSATSITVDAYPANTLSGKKYVISDPVDVDPALINLMLRLCEKHIAINRSMDNVPRYMALADEAWRDAAGADNRVFQQRRAGGPYPNVNLRLAAFPGPDVAVWS